MEEAMAPPPKRRKLEVDSMSDHTSYSDNSTALPEYSSALSQPAQSLPTHSSLGPPWPTPSGDTEQPTRTLQPAVGGIEDFKVLVPRQGTLLSNVDSAVNSVIAGVTSYVTLSESISISISAGVDLPPDSAPTVSSTFTETISTSSGSTVTSTITSLSSSNNLSASSTTISTSSNDTTSSITSSSSSTTGLASLPANLTTSVSSNSSGTSSTGSSTITSSSVESAIGFLATLSNGNVTTFTRQSGGFTTTLSDGEIFVIPGMSTSSTRSISRSSTTSPISTTTTSSEIPSSASSDIEPTTITSIATVAGGGANGGTPAYTAPTTSSTSSDGDSGGNNNDSTPPAGTIAGGVVGGAAGLAVLVLIAMLFIRWYRRKGQMGSQALPPGSADGDGAPDTSRGPGMAERAGLMPVMAALPGFFRHQNRSVGTSEPSERGFTRVSGRKLPSAFSEGMSSEAMSSPGMSTRPPPQMPLRNISPEDNLSGSSFYRDSEGFYGGAGEAARSVSPSSPSSDEPMRPPSGPELMTMSPGPQRQPQIHTGGPYTMSPTASDHPTSATFDRSETPSTLRNSRFTEDM